MINAINTILNYRSTLKEGYFMKITLSYGGCLSFSLAKKKESKRYSEKIWETILTIECRNPNSENIKTFLNVSKEKLAPYLQ